MLILIMNIAKLSPSLHTVVVFLYFILLSLNVEVLPRIKNSIFDLIFWCECFQDISIVNVS